MALPRINWQRGGLKATIAEINTETHNIYLDDISTAKSAFVVAGFAGTISKIDTIIDGAIATSDAVLTPKINTVSITGGGITVTQSGSAAGDKDSSTPTALNAIVVGDTIEIATDGASTNTVAVMVTITITL